MEPPARITPPAGFTLQAACARRQHRPPAPIARLRHHLLATDCQEQTHLSDEWNAAVPSVLLRVYPCLEAFQAVERESTAVLKIPSFPEAAKLVLVPGALALIRLQPGRLGEATDAARSADAAARRLGFDRHFFAIDHLRALAGLALERHDTGTAEHLTEQVLRLSEQRWSLFEFLALLDRAQVDRPTSQDRCPAQRGLIIGLHHCLPVPDRPNPGLARLTARLPGRRAGRPEAPSRLP